MSSPKEPSKRRGKAVKPQNGEAAAFAPGSAQGPRVFDARRVAEEMNLWWVDGDGSNFVLGLKIEHLEEHTNTKDKPDEH